MAVLSNTMMQGTAAISDDESYQIEKSLRFNEADSAHLVRTTNSKGNRRVWTWAAWVKRWDVENRSTLFSAGDGTSDTGWTGIEIETDEKLRVTGWNTSWKQTNRLFRDPGAWFHIVVAVDTNKSTATDRCKVYINGKLETSFSADNTITHQGEYAVNEGSKPNRIGGIDPAGVNNTTSNFYLADNYLIDGLSLSSAAFGSFDSTGNWNPKEFSLPAPNQNYTYSAGGNWTETNGTLSNHANLFDGNVSTSIASTGGGTYTITFPTPLDCNTQVEVSQAGFGGYYQLNAGEDDAGPRLTSSNFSSNNQILKAPSSGKLKKFTIHANGSDNINVKWIKVDGVTLIDGVTDPTTMNNKNDGTTWSDGSVTGAVYSGYPWTKCFNGKLAGNDGTSGAEGVTTVLTLPKAQTGIIDVYVQSNTVAIQVNGSSQATTGAVKDTDTDCWKVHLGEMTLTSIGVPASNELRGISVDGCLLLDGAVDNSFHLKFNNITSSTALGYDSFGASKDLSSADSKSLNGYPILKTNRLGTAKESGYRTDDNASSLVLALPLDSSNGVNDVHGSATTGSNLTNDAESGSENSTTKSKWYGSSRYFGSGDYIDYNDTSLAFGTGDFTVEGWFYWDDAYSGGGNMNRNYLWDMQESGGSAANAYQRMFLDGTGGSTATLYTMDDDGSDSSLEVWDAFPKDEWVHVAQVRTSGTIKTYCNGVERHSHTFSTNINAGQLTIGGTEHGGFGSWSGYIQDIKVYTSAVYSGGFTPGALPNDFTVGNLNTTASTARLMVGTPSYPSDFTTSGNKTSDQTGLSFSNETALDKGTYTGAATKIYKLSDNSSWPCKLSLAGGSSDRYAWYSSDLNNWTWIGNGAFNSQTAKYFAFSEGSGATTITVEWLDYVGSEDLDSFVDTPTNYGTDSGGGTVRGNYCTWNPLMIGDSTTQTFSQGNLEWKNDGADAWTGGTLGVTKGSSTTDKWYWEIEVKHGKGGYGICNYNNKDGDHTSWGGGTDRARIYLSSNGKLSNPAGGSDLTYGSNTTCVVGDIVGVALDLSPGGTSGKITFYKNGTSLGVAHTDIDTTRYWTIFANDYGENPVGGVLNAGQRAFKYTPPTDHKCLCTGNFTDTFSGDELNNPSKYFDVLTYKGTGAVNTVRGLNFQPDLIWIKNRGTSSTSHSIYDAVRGQGSNGYLRIESDDDDSQVDQSNLTAINSDGFTLTSDGNYTNGTNANHIAWCWDAGTAASGANDDGSIDIASGNQWKNATAGFSITKYTGPGSGDFTFGHGLNAVPEFIIIKQIDATGNWIVQHKGITLGSGRLLLNSTTNADTGHADGYWNSTAPTNTLISIGDNSNVYDSGGTFICYAWTPISGYSSFGKYTGNGSADGPFLYTGFRPRWFMMKEITDASTNWVVYDSERTKQNPVQHRLFPNSDTGGNTYDGSSSDLGVDFLSNGFKLRNNNSGINASNDEYIWCAFAEHPFKISRAR